MAPFTDAPCAQVMWIDAGSTLTGPTRTLNDILTHKGVLFTTGQDTDMTSYTHRSMLNTLGASLGKDPEWYKGKGSISANTIGFVKGSQAHRDIFPAWLKCAKVSLLLCFPIPKKEEISSAVVRF